MKVLVLGKGKTGKSVTRLLKEKKIDFDLFDTNEVANYDYSFVVKSPGIPYSNPVIEEFMKRDIRVISDIELVSYYHYITSIAITGTNGKTTAANLINDVIGNSYNTVLCGNIGYPIADAVLDNKKSDLYVVELSSFQLQGINDYKPRISVILNLDKAHQDMHKDLNEYYESKIRITRNQNRNDLVVTLHEDLEIQKRLNTRARVKTFSIHSDKADCYYRNGFVYYENKKIFKLNDNYNLINMLPAIIIGKELKIKDKLIRKTLEDFKGLPHRMELVKKNIYNDSKSTNPLSTLKAMRFLKKDIVLICGGKDRLESLDCLTNDLFRIRYCLCYGETKNKLKLFMDLNKVSTITCESLADAYLKASKLMGENTKLLFSPMMASLDEYKNYEDRGNQFKKLVS